MRRVARSADPAPGRQRPAPTAASISAGVTHGVALAGVVAIGVAALLPADHVDEGPVICPFRRLTGLPCPGCGLTRSWTYLVHGRVGDSFAVHPFGPLFLAAVVVLVGFVVVARVRRRPPPDLDEVVRHPVAIAVIVAWLGWAAVRLALAL